MQPKARMTIRFDGKGAAAPAAGRPGVPAAPAAQERESATHDDAGEAFPAIEKLEAEPLRAADAIEAWTSPYQDDIHALEAMIRHPAAASAPIGGFSGGRPNPEATREKPAAAPIRQRERPERESRRENVWGNQRENQREHYRENQRENDREGARGNHREGIAGRHQEGVRGNTIPFPGVMAGGGAEPGAGVGDETSEFEHGWLSDVSYSENSGGPSWWRIGATVLAAIVTGGIFGYLLLTVFTGEPLLPERSPSGAALPAIASSAGDAPAAGSGDLQAKLGDGAAAAGDTSGEASGTASGEAVSRASSANGSASGTVKAAGATGYWLQYGVFKTEQSMKDAMAELEAKGIASASDTSDGYRVFAGVAPTKEAAAELESLLQGTSVYVKAMATDALSLGGKDGPAWAAVLGSGTALAGEIAGFSASALAGAAPEADIQSIRTAHQTWLQAVQQAGAAAGETAKLAQAEGEQLGAAVTALNSYVEKPSDKLLWSAQSAVMSAMLTDRAIRAELSGAAK